MFFDGFVIEKTTFRGIAFLLTNDLDTDFLGFVFNLSNQLVKRNADEILVVPFPDFDILFPVVIVADDDVPDMVLIGVIDNETE